MGLRRCKHVFSVREGQDSCSVACILHMGSGFEGLKVVGLFEFLLVGSFVCSCVYFLYTCLTFFYKIYYL
jgi:hypothetical protein